MNQIALYALIFTFGALFGAAVMSLLAIVKNNSCLNCKEWRQGFEHGYKIGLEEPREKTGSEKGPDQGSSH